MAGFGRLGLRVYDEQRFQSRAEFSRIKLDELRSRLNKAKYPRSFSNFTIYTAGSYGRLEASKHSDIDLFFVMAKPRDALSEIRVPEIRMLSELIEIGYMMSFPKFSNDGHFLKILFLDDILNNLGSPADDYFNHFTARMLLMLESKSVYGDPIYNRVLNKTIESYFRDYEHHPTDFRPTFLINDIIRFWKTLCLNYEHKRNQVETRATLKHKIKNFKLGYSRLLTCFATVAMLSTYRDTISPKDVARICHMTPTERLIFLARDKPKLKPTVKDALQLYGWFLSKTALSTSQLENYFSKKSNRVEAFGNARKFGDKIFAILRLLDEENKKPPLFGSVMPVFYGLYVADEKLAAAFDLIRFLAEPSFYRRAHITVRGPYPDKLAPEIEAIWKKKRYKIYFSGIGSFFSDSEKTGASNSQNTVFLKCNIPGIDAVWNKPDYGEGIVPHLTLYDGKDRGFAYSLLEILNQIKWDFAADSTELTLIQTKAKPAILTDFAAHQNLYDEILARPIDYRAVRIQLPRQRLIYMSWVVRFIEQNYTNYGRPSDLSNAS